MKVKRKTGERTRAAQKQRKTKRKRMKRKKDRGQEGSVWLVLILEWIGRFEKKMNHQEVEMKEVVRDPTP